MSISNDRTSKILAIIVCLICGLLAVTVYLIYWQRHADRNLRAKTSGGFIDIQGQLSDMRKFTQSELSDIRKFTKFSRAVVSDTIQIDLASNIARLIPESGSRDEPILPVSMTPINDDDFVVANYSKLYFISKKTHVVAELKLPECYIPIVNPTGVFFSVVFGQLFVANYTGQDVLVFNLSFPNATRIPKLTLAARITHPLGVEGPEGVCISDGGRYMAVANWEGKNVALFENQDGLWVYRWQRPLLSAHGVTILGDIVYASGAGAVVAMDVVDGTERHKLTEAFGRSILFATGVARTRDNNLLVSDAINGRIIKVSRDLVPIWNLGCNGPTYSNLSMPYAVYNWSKDIVILSTLQDRIIFIPDDFGHAPSSLTFHDHWTWATDRTTTFGVGNNWSWQGTTNTDSPVVSFLGLGFLPDYGAFISVAQPAVRLMMPGSDESCWYLDYVCYVCSSACNQDLVALICNSCPFCLVIHRKTGFLERLPMGEVDCWGRGSNLFCPKRERTVASIRSEELKENLAESFALLLPFGTLDRLASFLGMPLEALQKEFVSSSGIAFVADLRASGLEALKEEDLMGIGARYFCRVGSSGENVGIIEAWLVYALTGENFGTLDTSKCLHRPDVREN